MSHIRNEMVECENVELNRSPFARFMNSIGHRRTFFWEGPYANNGDRLIRMGMERLLMEANCDLVDKPGLAEQIIINGSGRYQDCWPGAFDDIIRFRKEFPRTPLIVAPQVFRVRNVDFKAICSISDARMILFARDDMSGTELRETGLPAHCEVHLSQDVAFELANSDFINGLQRTALERHVLVAMRKDEHGCAGLLARTKGIWLPKKIRRPLSWLRDRIVAQVSMDVINTMLREECISTSVPRIYRDVSVSVSFDDFVALVRDAALIVTDRLHVAVFGHLLKKRVIIVCAPGYIGKKLRGVYEFSMKGPDSRTRLYEKATRGENHEPML